MQNALDILKFVVEEAEAQAKKPTRRRAPRKEAAVEPPAVETDECGACGADLPVDATECGTCGARFG